MYEITPYLKNLHLADKENWEQARFNAYVTAQINSTKKLQPTDIMAFPWDSKVTSNTSISNEDIERLKQKAKQYGKI